MTNGRSLSVFPQAPVDLIAITVGGCQVILAWSECDAGGLGFRVERAEGIGSACRFSELGRTGPHVTAFRDESVKPRTAYSYRVYAWNASGDSPPTDVVEVTPPQDETELPVDEE